MLPSFSSMHRWPLFAIVGALVVAFLAGATPTGAQGEPPAKPRGLQVSTEPGSLEVPLNWGDVDGAAGYWVRWRSVNNEEKLNQGVRVEDSEAAITVADYGVWVVRVQACNDAGCGKPLAKRFTVESAPEPTPTSEPTPEPTATPTPEPTEEPTPELNPAPEVTTPCGDGVIVPNPGDNPELVADCEALWASRDVLDPEGVLLASWNANTALGNWRSVTVGGNPARVTRLKLAILGINGSIPAALGRLTGITWMQLNMNNLTGEVPSELGNLTKLTELSLAYNQLTGSAPASLAKLTNLKQIHLNNNQLTGPIPPEYGNLNVSHFHLSFNGFTGSIPPELGNIDELGGLFLDNNQLEGDIPDELKNPKYIHTFALQNNQLSGGLPDWIGKRSYWYIFLNNNQFVGSIPDLSELSYLSELRLGGNSLTGCIADSLRSQVTTPYSSTSPYGSVGAPFCADGSME